MIIKTYSLSLLAREAVPKCPVCDKPLERKHVKAGIRLTCHHCKQLDKLIRYEEGHA